MKPLPLLLSTLLGVLALVSLNSCDDCSNYDPPYFGFSFRILDEDMKELVGIDLPYDHTEIQLLVSGNDVISTFNYDPILRVYTFSVNISGLDIFNNISYELVLSPTESLPLDMQVRRTDGSCGDRFNLDFIKLQGKSVNITTDPILFLKAS